MKKIITFLVMVVICALPALSYGERVKARGLSLCESGREAFAREKALDEARRAAIEKAVGVHVESSTLVESFRVVKDRIFTRSSGYISNMEILSERKTDFGSYEVVIEADVKVSDMVNDLDRFKKALSWQRNPRVALTLHSGMKKEYMPAGSQAISMLTNKLKEKGFGVFKHNSGGDIRMGLLLEVSLEHSSGKTEYQDVELTLNEVSLTVGIIRPEDLEVLATAHAVKSLAGENRLKVLEKAIRFCVLSVWNDLSLRLTKVWEKELYSQRDIRLFVRGAPSHKKAREILSVFKNDVAGVAGARLMSYGKKKAGYALKYRGWPEQLINEMEMAYFKSRCFEPEVLSIRGNKITVKIKGK